MYARKGAVMSKVIEVTDATFEREVLQSEVPVEVDFWAPWCGPCRMVAPIYDKLAEEYPNFKFCKINVDEHREVAMSFGIQSIPMQMFFANGEKVDELLGAVPESQIRKKVDDVVEKHPVDERSRLKAILSSWIEHNRKDAERFGKLEGKAGELSTDPAFEEIRQAAKEIDDLNQRLSRLLDEL
jgi:thioredoxin 1